MKNKDFERGVEVVVGVIIKNFKEEILLCKSSKWENKWVICGGHIEPGETIEDAALREAKEEVGLSLKPLGVISFGELINSPDFHRPAHLIYFDVLCEAKNEDIKIDEKEIQDFKWVSLEESLGMDLGGGTKQAMEEYLEFVNKK